MTGNVASLNTGKKLIADDIVKPLRLPKVVRDYDLSPEVGKRITQINEPPILPLGMLFEMDRWCVSLANDADAVRHKHTTKITRSN